MSRPASTVLLASVVASLAFAAHAQYPSKRDLGGIWTNASLTPLTRPPGVADLEVSPEEAARIVAARGMVSGSKAPRYSDPAAGAPEKGAPDFGIRGYDNGWIAPGDQLAIVRGHYRTSNIVDPPSGQLPYRDKAAASAKAALASHKYAMGDDPYEGPESATPWERCLIGFGGTGGPGMLSVLYNNTYQFVQTGDHLAIVVEMVHDVRDIPIFPTAEQARKRHLPSSIRPWLGDSVGWWESDTLAVETTNVRPLEAENNPFLLSPNAKIIEHFTRTGPKEIAYAFTVDDPDTYTQKWTAELTFRPQNEIYEYACHEGNYALTGILQGARNKERATSAAREVKATGRGGGH